MDSNSDFAVEIGSLLSSTLHVSVTTYTIDKIVLLVGEFAEEKLNSFMEGMFEKILANGHHADYAILLRKIRETGGRNLIRPMLDICQNYFEEGVGFPGGSAKGLDPQDQQSVDRWHNCIEFIGHVFAEKLIPAKVMSELVHDCIGLGKLSLGHAEVAAEHMLEGVLKLLPIIGQTAESTQSGKVFLNVTVARLVDLKRTETCEGLASYPDYMLSLIDSVMELRKNDWMPMLIFQIEVVSSVDLEERRKSEDGLAYTQQEFLDWYDDLHKWESAAICPDIIRARTLSGEICAALHGTLGELSVQALRKQVSFITGTPDKAIKFIVLGETSSTA